LDEGISGKLISGIGGSFRRNTHSLKMLKNIGSKKELLHIERAKEQYSFAQYDQEYYLKLDIHERDDMAALITRAKKVLNLAKTKKFPGGKPKRRNHHPLLLGAGMSGPGEKKFAGRAPTVPGLGQQFGAQINSLMSLGSLIGKGSK